MDFPSKNVKVTCQWHRKYGASQVFMFRIRRDGRPLTLHRQWHKDENAA